MRRISSPACRCRWTAGRSSTWSEGRARAACARRSPPPAGRRSPHAPGPTVPVPCVLVHHGGDPLLVRDLAREHLLFVGAEIPLVAHIEALAIDRIGIH